MEIGSTPPGDVTIDPSLVHTLLEDQHPDLAHLPLADAGHGWDNHLYTLGNDLAVRLPRRAAAAGLIEHEQRWLPDIATRLPLPVPVPVRVGVPGRGYPWRWSIVPWFTGEPAIVSPPTDAVQTANTIATFLAAMHQPAPSAAPQNPVRGVPLADRTDAVHARVRALEDAIDRRTVLALWSDVVRTPVWSGPSIWIHGDLHPGNLLVRDGRVCAIVDFGDLAAGDPATDLAIAWMLLPAFARPKFWMALREQCAWLDDHAPARARGWALNLALAFLANSRDGDAMRRIGRTTLDAVIAG